MQYYIRVPPKSKGSMFLTPSNVLVNSALAVCVRKPTNDVMSLQGNGSNSWQCLVDEKSRTCIMLWFVYITVGVEWQRQEAAFEPEARDHRSDMRTDHWDRGHWSRCRSQVLHGQHR